MGGKGRRRGVDGVERVGGNREGLSVGWRKVVEFGVTVQQAQIAKRGKEEVRKRDQTGGMLGGVTEAL